MLPAPGRRVAWMAAGAAWLVLAGFALPSAAEAEPPGAGAIGGRFVSCAGGLASVRVSVEDGTRTAVSGPTGTFELRDLPAGTFVLIVEAQGQRGTIAGVQVAAGRVTDVGEINLTDLGADPGHCGACGRRCPSDAACVYGVCLCPEGRIVCGDTCTTLADLDHCLACQNRCVAWPSMIPRCGPSDCVFECAAGTADCDNRRLTGCETRIDSDSNNCGACGHVCAPGQRCVRSRCQ